MSTISFPAVGVGGLTESQWQQMFDTPDGIMQDFVGTGFGLTINSGANTATIAATDATACVDGYYLKVTAPETFSIPTAAGTYLIAVKYDPALNVTSDGTNANPLGPCRLVMTAGALTSPGGEKYLLLYRIVRAASQNLSDSPITDFRHWGGPTQYIVTMPAEALLDPETNVSGFGQFSLGTTIYQQNPPATFRRVLVAGTPKWIRSNKQVALPLASNLASPSTSAPVYYLDDSNVVHLEGTVGRADGKALSSSDSTDVALATLPVGARPYTLIRWTAFGKPSSGRGVATGEVHPTTGVVTLYGPASGSIIWVDLSSISFRAKLT